MKAEYWLHGGGQEVECYARDATRVVRNCERVGYGMRKCAGSRARERGLDEWTAELGAGDALVHSQRSHVAAPVFRSAGQSAVRLRAVRASSVMAHATHVEFDG